jgi:hypothetical protein
MSQKNLAEHFKATGSARYLKQAEQSELTRYRIQQQN